MSVSIQQDTTISYLGTRLPVSLDTSFTVRGIGGLWEESVMPFAVPEIVIGTLLGTDLMVRWIPQTSIEGSETFGVFGLGVRHVQAVWQRAGAEDDDGDQIVRISTFAANVQVGKRFGLLGVYAALQSEKSDGEVKYEYIAEETGVDEPVPVRFEISGINKMRAVLGVDLGLGPLHASADMNFGRMNVVTAALGVRF
jgi:hypothetical protein